MLLFVVGLVIWGQSLGRLGALRSMRFGLIGMAALAPAIYVLNHATPGDTPRIVVALAWAGLALLVASGFTPAALAHLSDLSEADPTRRGAVMGLYSVLLGLGQFLGATIASPLVGAFRVDGLVLHTLILTGVSALGVAILSFQPSPAPRPASLRTEPEG
jgi:MFS family permease